MTAINEIPGAWRLQTQLMGIETAIADLKTGALISGISVLAAPSPEPQGIGQPLKEETRVALDPPIDDQVAIDGAIAMLEGQMNKLITELQSLGFTYTGTSIPAQKPVEPVILPELERLMQTTPPPPLPPMPFPNPPPGQPMPPPPHPEGLPMVPPLPPEALQLPDYQPDLPVPLVETAPAVGDQPPPEPPPPPVTPVMPTRPQLNRN
jgi:hypothetical protein